MDLMEYLRQQLKQERNLRKRRVYNWDLIKTLINSYPAGTTIRSSELSILLGYKSSASSIYPILNGMLNKGEISRTYIPGKPGYTYKVLKPGNTYDRERGKAVVTLPKVEETPQTEVRTEVREEANTEKTYTFEELEELAMKLQFYRNSGVTSAAQFLESLKEK